MTRKKQVTRQPKRRGSRASPSTGRSRASRSLACTPAFTTFVIEQLADLDEVVGRAMFGGVGLYQRGVFFGILSRDRLYLKVDDINRPDYERARSRPFKPYPDRAGTMQYYEVPVTVLESTRELTDWARKAVAAAKRASDR
jgi:DNA transformation protein